MNFCADDFDTREGELYTAQDHRLLLESGMMHLSVRGYSIDVSWLPEHDPYGRYIITVYRGTWENRVFRFEEKDPLNVWPLLYRIGHDLSQPIVVASGSTTSTITDKSVIRSR